MLGKKFLALIFIVCFFVCGVYAAEDGDNAPLAAVTTAKHIKYENERVSFDLAVPKIEGLTDSEFQNILNDNFMNLILKSKEEMEKNVEDEAGYFEYLKEQGYSPRPYTLNISYDLKNTGDILSFTVTFYHYLGGAHGSTLVTCYNIDTVKNKVIKLKDLFNKIDTDYETVINQEISRQISEHMKDGSRDYFTGDEGFKAISDSQPFYVQGENLVILFNQYEIAPYSSGVIEFFMPLSKL